MKKILIASIFLFFFVSNVFAAPIVVIPGESAGYMYFPTQVTTAGGGGGGEPVTGVGGVTFYKYTNNNDWSVSAKSQSCGTGCVTYNFNTGAGFTTFTSTRPVDWTDKNDVILGNGICRQATTCSVWVDEGTNFEIRAHRYEVSVSKNAQAVASGLVITSSFAGQTESCGIGEAGCLMLKGVEDKSYTLSSVATCTVGGVHQTGSGSQSCTTGGVNVAFGQGAIYIQKEYGLTTNYEITYGSQVCPAASTNCTFYGHGTGQTLTTSEPGGLSWNFGSSWSELSVTSPVFTVTDGMTISVSSGFPFTVTRDNASDRNYTLNLGGQSCPAGTASCNFIAIGSGHTLTAGKSVYWKVNAGAYSGYSATSPTFSVTGPSSVSLGTHTGYSFTVTRDLASNRNYTISYLDQTCAAGGASCTFYGMGTGQFLTASVSNVWKVNAGAWGNYSATSPTFSVTGPSSVSLGTMPGYPCSFQVLQCSTLYEPVYNGATQVGWFSAKTVLDLYVVQMANQSGWPAWASGTHSLGESELLQVCSMPGSLGFGIGLYAIQGTCSWSEGTQTCYAVNFSGCSSMWWSANGFDAIQVFRYRY